MNLKTMILLNILIPVYTLLNTGTFGWVQHKSKQVSDRISNFYDTDDDNKTLLKAIRRVADIEEQNKKDSGIVLYEAFHMKGNSACGFMGIQEEDKFIIFLGIVLKEPDIRPMALLALKKVYNVDTTYLVGQKWLLEYNLLL